MYFKPDVRIDIERYVRYSALVQDVKYLRVQAHALQYIALDCIIAVRGWMDGWMDGWITPVFA